MDTEPCSRPPLLAAVAADQNHLLMLSGQTDWDLEPSPLKIKKQKNTDLKMSCNNQQTGADRFVGAFFVEEKNP